MLGFKRSKLFLQNISFGWGLLQPREEYYYQLFQKIFKYVIHLVFKMQMLQIA